MEAPYTNSFHMVGNCTVVSVSAGICSCRPHPRIPKSVDAQVFIWNDVVFVYNLCTSSDKLYIIFRLLVLPNTM